MNRPSPTVLFALPLPPPYSGQEMITVMLLTSPLPERFHIVHLDTSNKVSNVNRGRLDFHNAAATVRNSLRLLAMLFRHRPDLVNIPMPKNRMGFVKYATFVVPSKWSGAKVISRSGGGHFDKFYESEPGWMQSFVRFTLRHVDAVIVRADCLKAPFKPFFRADQIWTVYLGLDCTMFDSVLDGTEEKGSGTRVLYVGHISKAKGALDLLEATAQVVEHYPAVEFQFAGNVLDRERNITFIDNPDDIAAEVERLVNDPRLEGSVRMLGIISGQEKLQTIAAADIFVLPSYAEGFPFAVLEAMLAGKAVITTPVGALPEVFVHEKHLLFVEPGDIQGLSDALERLLRDPQLRKKLGDTARKTVQDHYNLDILADRMEEVFLHVLDS